MRIVFDVLVQGILLGGLYALYAAGLSLIFGVMRLVNLAHGDLIVLAGFLILALNTSLGINLWVAAVLIVVVMFALGYLLQTGILNRSLGPDILPPLLMTFGLSIIIQNGLLEAFSANTRRLQAGPLETASIQLGDGMAIGVLPLITFLTAVLVIVALNQVFYRTALGRAFRAVSDDPTTSQLMGIDNRRLFGIAMGIALAVAAIAALFIGIRANFNPAAGPERLIYAFEAVIIGGLGSLWGTLAGGIVLAVAQQIGAQINPAWQVLGGHIAFLVILVLRPRGLFPRAVD